MEQDLKITISPNPVAMTAFNHLHIFLFVFYLFWFARECLLRDCLRVVLSAGGLVAPCSKRCCAKLKRSSCSLLVSQGRVGVCSYRSLVLFLSSLLFSLLFSSLLFSSLLFSLLFSSLLLCSWSRGVFVILKNNKN